MFTAALYIIRIIQMRKLKKLEDLPKDRWRASGSHCGLNRNFLAWCWGPAVLDHRCTDMETGGCCWKSSRASL